MSDKVIIIIIAVINFVMWFVVLDYIRKTNQFHSGLEKLQAELIKKQENYIHATHENMCSMTKMNLEAMNEFLKSIGKIEGTADEKENRQ